ncbi:chorismate mutase [Geothrix sp. PMB-07]|uniref:chorismate mutase n=1 Tax=Geothrix sp. PMB-07 TaxID=3068640 RepID=UPI002742931C|nr:chorismate mutase [Geothrix sp. PMB-07]WLT32723.1 chorismate mutase [Geothrix sp. PMB-07]
MQKYREQIAGLDRAILEALNQRIHLVRQLRDHKTAQGLGFHDAAQEDRLMGHLRQANQGPLPDEGLREIFSLILAWTKRGAVPEGPQGD